jgi:tRNA 5-methylaminomethyl-2-thiouridine biosynthesis bifunctional protein
VTLSEAPSGPVLAPARIRYRDDQPYSLDFGDIYHAPDGDAEVRRVMIEPCRIDDLARQRAGDARAPVRIGELGFGSGYNFAVAVERCVAAGARLHFVSFEVAPLDAPDLAAIAGQRHHVHPIYQALAAAYPPRIRGWHRRHFLDGRVCLSLWWGAADAGLADLRGRQRQPFDAWFLDGFAPDRNPEMWEPSLFEHIAALSSRGTRVATFTAAGRVRRGLEAAGFAMRRIDQQPHKHETLAGSFRDEGLRGFTAPVEVVVAGAGLAGASAAWHLARAGIHVRLMDPASDAPGSERAPAENSAAGSAPADPHDPASAPVGGAASKIPATVLHGRLLADGSTAADLRCHGFLYASEAVRTLAGFNPCGVLQLAGGAQQEAKLRVLAQRYGPSGSWLRWLDADAAAELAGWRVDVGGLHFPGGGAVATPRLVAALMAHPGILTIAAPLGEPDPGRPTILACGAGTRDFAAARYLELAPVHGQIDVVALPDLPRLPLVGNGYLLTDRGLLAAGATYEYRPWDPAEATRSNLEQLLGRAYTWRGRYRGTRCVSSDRTAVAGALTDASGKPLDNLYVSAGHGSSGNVSAHLAAAVLAAQVSGEFAPVERRLEAALAPLRFHERQARRGFRHGAGP